MNKECFRGLILAAGRGRRLGPIGDAGPKCLLSLAGQSLLQWQLTALQQAGMEEIAIVKGHQGSQIDFPPDRSFENPSWATSSIVRSLCCAGDWLKERPCLIAYGDIVYRADHVRKLQADPDPIVIAYDTLWRQLWQDRFLQPELDAESFRQTDGYLTEIGRKGADLSQIEGQYLGLIKLTPSGWKTIVHFLSHLSADLIDHLDITALLARMIEGGIPLRAVAVHGGWCEIDTAADLELYERKIQSGKAWPHDWRV